MASLKGKTVFVTGASRGIGLAIAKRAARDGANIAIAAKTADPNPKLEGTIHSAAKEIENAGGNALAIPCDIRDEAEVQQVVDGRAQRRHRLAAVDGTEPAALDHPYQRREQPVVQREVLAEPRRRGRAGTRRQPQFHRAQSVRRHG